MTNPPPAPPPDLSPRRTWLLAALLLPIPTIAVLCLQGPTAILRMNALTLHDGMRYYEVSLSPFGEPPYCPEPIRYTRVLFPALVHATASAVGVVVRAAGGAGWLQETFPYDGFTVPNYALLHAFVYHACLLVTAWGATIILGKYLRNNAVAILINVVLLQVVLLRGLLTPFDIAVVILCVRATDAWVGSDRPSWRAGGALVAALAAGGLDREVFLGFFPVVLVCHLGRFGFAFIARLTAVLAVSLGVVAAWYAAYSATHDTNLVSAVREFMRLNSTPLPLQAFPAALRSTNTAFPNLQAPVLIALTCYVVVRLVFLLRGELRRWRRGEALNPAGVWGVVVCAVYLRAGEPIIGDLFNYCRVVLLAPFILEDIRDAYEFLIRRLGRLAVVLVAAAAVGYLLASIWLQAAEWTRTIFSNAKPAQCAEVQNSSGLRLLPETPPPIYRP